ncbi:MAG: hypothetical protein EON98_08220 [Chitinophagaceae bacterium]|nr:MAG: hypothetical protein EON98_08220 [Chitinophagaceae bacterium]
MMRTTIFAFCMIVMGCSGKAQSANAIVNHKWILVSAKTAEPTDLNNRGSKSTDLFAQYPPCSTDDIYHFKEKGVFVSDENKDICQLPATHTGSWKISGKDSITINFGVQDIIMTFKISSVSNTDMKLITRQKLKASEADVIYTFKRLD